MLGQAPKGAPTESAKRGVDAFARGVCPAAVGNECSGPDFDDSMFLTR